MKNRIKAILLKFYLRWTPNEHPISTDGPDANHIYIRVYGLHPVNDEAPCVIESISSDSVTCVYFDESAQKNVVTVPLSECLTKRIEIKYYRPGFNVAYHNIYEPLGDLLGGIHFRRIGQRLFDTRLKTVEGQMRILKHAVDLHKSGFGAEFPPLEEIISGKRHIRLHDLMAYIHGEKLLESTKYNEHIQRLEFQVRALIESGDLTLVGDYSSFSRFAVSPQAINTLAAHELEMRKFRDSQKWVKWLVLITAIYAAATIFQVWISWPTDSEQETVEIR